MYLSKQLLLSAFHQLAQLDGGNVQQGLTKKVSYIRHFLALDEFCKSNKVDELDTTILQQKKDFISCVARVVGIEESKSYTQNFVEIKELSDCGVGSNFFGGGPVLTSQQSSNLLAYPSKGLPLLDVKRQRVWMGSEAYENIQEYLSDEKLRAALFLWIARSYNGFSSEVELYTELQGYCNELYSKKLQRAIFPSADAVAMFVGEAKVPVLSNRCAEFSAIDFDSAKGVAAGTLDTGIYAPYLAAIRTKPFVLLAGISGTGKSRMVRQLARGCCPEKDEGGNTHPLYDEQKPGNFEMIQVRPNWHDSSELMGYVTRIVRQNEPPKYLVTAFVEFLAKAWVYREVPFFLCLDEMNLAPVEQYFAEYLSVIETRKRQAVKLGGEEVELITTDPIVRWENLERETFANVVKDIFDGKKWANAALHGRVDAVKKLIENDKGIRIPPNLVVMGTVNMDETTCSFSRKVLDRAMSFELNDVSDMYDPEKIAGEGDAAFGSIKPESAMSRMLTGKEAYDADNGIGEKVLAVLHLLNEEDVDAKKEDGSDDTGHKMSLLAKTPFKIAYRTRNEIMIYCLERCGGAAGVCALPQALDEALSMKVLSRIEGDNQHVPKKWLVTLSATIEDELKKLDGYDKGRCGVCREKLAEMAAQSDSGYTSFWTR